MEILRRLIERAEQWDRVWVSAWYGIIAVILLYEFWSLLDRKESTPPLTNVLVAEVPWYVTVPFLAWLLIHFASRYAGHPLL